jgi:hypothetical protein
VEFRRLVTAATAKPDTYFSNDANTIKFLASTAVLGPLPDLRSQNLETISRLGFDRPQLEAVCGGGIQTPDAKRQPSLLPVGTLIP